MPTSRSTTRPRAGAGGWGPCGSDSTSPTTAPTSTAGPQPSLRTVQGELETALATCCGCHAVARDVCRAHRHRRARPRPGGPPRRRADVLAASGGRPTAVDALVRRLNGVLPADVRVRRAARRRTASTPASPRCGGATPTGSPTDRSWSTRCARPCWPGRAARPRRDERAPRRCWVEHDFAAFCKQREGRPRSGPCSTSRWERRDDAGLAVATVRADAFCHSMVRALVGCLVAVGEGRRPPEWAGEVLRPGSATRR